MKFDDVIRESITAIFSSPVLQETLFLKGGAALRLMENINSRMSLDMDFSMESKVEHPEEFFHEMTKVLSAKFSQKGLDVINARFARRPKIKRRGKKKTWGGWQFTFKLSEKIHRNEKIEQRVKGALIPGGSSSSKIEIQLSEYEYCEIIEIITIDGVDINVYSPILLVLEKIRAICQQHPLYEYSLNKNRSRDFFDIFSILKIYRNKPEFILELAANIDPVFEAKQVPMTLLTEGEVFESQFIDGQGHGFQAVKDTVKGKVEDYYFYVEQLKILVGLILKAREELGK